MARKPSAVQGARVVGARYLRTKRSQNPEGRMPLMEHLAELRSRLLKAAVVLVLAMIVALFLHKQLWSLVNRPCCEAVIRGEKGCTQAGDQLVVNGIFEGFFLQIKIAFYAALIASSPV